jgi:hypothetical protein
MIILLISHELKKIHNRKIFHRGKEREMELDLEREEKEGRRKNNPRERAVIEAYEKGGWEIVTRGFPCFLARKAGKPVRLVWVERKNVNPEKAGLKANQRKMISIFTSILGGDHLNRIRIVDPERPDPLDP